jgi:hypothetical protein
LVPAVTVDSERTAASTMPYRLTLVWAMAAALAMLRAATANRRFFWLMGSFSGGNGDSMNRVIVLKRASAEPAV